MMNSRNEMREEPEKIKKWREEQKTRLEEKGKFIIFVLLLTIFSIQTQQLPENR